MLLVMEAPAERPVRIVALVLRRWSHWSLLTWVWVLLVLCPMILLLLRVRYLMGDSLRQIRGYRLVRFQGMAFWSWCRGQARATFLRIG
jgi:hypothetical protein